MMFRVRTPLIDRDELKLHKKTAAAKFSFTMSGFMSALSLFLKIRF